MVKGKKAEHKEPKYVYDREKAAERQTNIKLLAELESTSDSSSSSESTDFAVSMDDMGEEEEEQEDGEAFDKLDNLYETDTESIQEEEPEYTQCKPLEETVDFFKVLGGIPNVDNISEDISVKSIKMEKTHTEVSGKDLGKFVDPLTGGDIRSSDESRSTDDVPDSAGDGNVEEIDDGNISDGSDLFILDDTYAEDEDIKKVADAEDTLENFLEMDAHKDVSVDDDIDWEAVAKEQEAKRVQQNTLELITDLIKRVVDAVEYVSPETILRQNLDKRKLIKELLSKLPIYAVEKSVCQFLHRKTVEYFRRKKSFRPIMPDHPKTIQQDKLKFQNATQRLDYLLEKEAKLNSSTAEIIENLKNDYNQAKEETDTQVQLFARMVKSNLFRENNPKTNALIEQLLLRMNKYRKEVNEVRLAMFTHLHNQARLTAELSKLEDLGNGLSMRDFGNLQAETQAMGKKIEERNAELNKLHIRCRSDIHTMAHYKEKQKMLRNVIAIQKSVLGTILDNKERMRDRLHCLKLIHKGIRSQIGDLSFQGGLLDKPALMFDYDETVKRLHEQHAIIDGLRKSLFTTQHKIDSIVKLCPELKLK